MRKRWNRIVSASWFPVAVIAAILCIVAAVYTGISGNNSPVTEGTNTALLPIQRAVTHMAVYAADTYNKYFEYDKLKEENESLRQQVADLTRQLEDAQSAVSENEDLRAMLGVAERNTEFTYAGAEVVGRTLDEWSSVLWIDAGSLDGLEKNDCVVTAQGMVGYISEINQHSAKVTTIIDSNMSAAARMVRTGEIAVANGDYQLMADGKLKISYLNETADIVVGDTVQTSGSGGLFPRGLEIGTVESILTERDGMSNYAVIQPLVDITTLTRVYIITDTVTE